MTKEKTKDLFDITRPETAEAMRSYLLGDWEKAHKIFEKLSEEDPGNHFYHFILGEIHYAMGRLEDAVGCYAKAIERKPDFGIAYYKTGVCYYRMGLLEKSLKSFSTLLSMKDQSHVMASYFFGLINEFLGNDEEAEKGFGILRSDSRESRIAGFYLAQIKIRHQKYPEALALLDELLEATPNLAEVHYQKGVALMGMHKNMEAIASFRKTLQLNPGDQRTRSTLELLTEVPEP
jgi:tetratricopeptide (TPR) repeat protein